MKTTHSGWLYLTPAVVAAFNPAGDSMLQPKGQAGWSILVPTSSTRSGSVRFELSAEATHFLQRFIAARKHGHALRANVPLLTLHPNGAKPISYSTLERYCQKILRQAIGREDRRWSPHGLRKAMALSLLKSTHDFYQPQPALGHASMTTSLHHFSSASEDLTKAV